MMCEQSCSNSVGWSVMAAVIFHEVPQELGDYLVLVKHGVPKYRALLFNFISALSCYVGAIAVLAASSHDEAVNAYLVAFSAVRVALLLCVCVCVCVRARARMCVCQRPDAVLATSTAYMCAGRTVVHWCHGRVAQLAATRCGEALPASILPDHAGPRRAGLDTTP